MQNKNIVKNGQKLIIWEKSDYFDDWQNNKETFSAVSTQIDLA